MPTREYSVRLEAFEGPLDLLLFLVRRCEVDIHDIPIAAVTEQYLSFLSDLGGTGGAAPRIDIEQAGEFLVMAATLMEIKSRLIGGAAAKGDGGEGAGAGQGRDGAQAGGEGGDPRAELVRQLIEYKTFRDATDRLEERRSAWESRFPAGRAAVARVEEEPGEAEGAHGGEGGGGVEVDDLELIDLVEAFARIVESVDFNRVGEHRVVVDDTPVEVHGERIVRRLMDLVEGGVERERAAVPFASLFEQRTRAEMVGVFLAVLELVRQQRLRVRQGPAEEGGGDPAGGGGGRGEIVLMLGEAAGVA